MSKTKEKSRITRLEASSLMNNVVEKAKITINEEGFIYPMFILFSKGELEGDFEHPYVLKVFHSAYDAEDGFPFLGNDGQPINRSYVVLSSKNEDSEKHRLPIAQELAMKFKPDMIGLVEPILYRITKGEPRIDFDLDPEAMTVLHALYYLRGDPSVRIMNIPYIDKGKVTTLELEAKKDVFMAHSGWAKQAQFYSPRILNPFK